MDRGGVVDRAGDARRVEVIAQRIALWGGDDEEVVDVIAVRIGRLGEYHVAAGQRLGQRHGRLPSALVPVVEPAQLDVEDRRL